MGVGWCFSVAMHTAPSRRRRDGVVYHFLVAIVARARRSFCVILFCCLRKFFLPIFIFWSGAATNAHTPQQQHNNKIRFIGGKHQRQAVPFDFFCGARTTPRARHPLPRRRREPTTPTHPHQRAGDMGGHAQCVRSPARLRTSIDGAPLRRVRADCLVYIVYACIYSNGGFLYAAALNVCLQYALRWAPITPRRRQWECTFLW